MNGIDSISLSILVFILLALIAILVDAFFKIRLGIIFIVITIICGIVCYRLYDPLSEIPEEVDGKYINVVKNNDDVDIEITAKLKDGGVTRTSKYNLKGKDFADDEINNTNKEFTKLLTRMLDNRHKALDSLEQVPVNKECKIITSDNKQYKICPIGE